MAFKSLKSKQWIFQQIRKACLENKDHLVKFSELTDGKLSDANRQHLVDYMHKSTYWTLIDCEGNLGKAKKLYYPNKAHAYKLFHYRFSSLNLHYGADYHLTCHVWHSNKTVVKFVFEDLCLTKKPE